MTYKAKFKLYEDTKKLKKRLNNIADMQDVGVIKVLSCYPRNGYMYITYDAKEKVI